MLTTPRLRLAMQKSGRLADPTRVLLSQMGMRFNHRSDDLICVGEDEPVDLLMVRDDDIPALIEDGVCDIGVVGRNVLREHQGNTRDKSSGLIELRGLGFGACRLALAIPRDNEWRGITDLQSRRIATSHPNILQNWLCEQNIDSQVITLAGSVEIAPRLGKADLVCDLVSSGATLAANQLREVMTVMESEAVLVARQSRPSDADTIQVSALLRRLDGCLKRRDSRLVLWQVNRRDLPQVMRCIPLAQTTCVSSIEGELERISVQAISPAQLSWQQMEAMQAAGANSVLVLPVERMLA